MRFATRSGIIIAAFAFVTATADSAMSIDAIQSNDQNYRQVYTPPFPFRHRYLLCYPPPRCRYPNVPVCLRWNKPGCCLMWQCGRMWMG